MIDGYVFLNLVVYNLPMSIFVVAVTALIYGKKLINSGGLSRLAISTLVTAVAAALCRVIAVQAFGAPVSVLGLFGEHPSAAAALIWGLGLTSAIALLVVPLVHRGADFRSATAPHSAAVPAPAASTRSYPPATIATNAVTSPTTTGSDDLWAAALKEFEGPQRSAGMWARCFTSSGGNENAAKAAYLEERVAQLLEANRERRMADEARAQEQGQRWSTLRSAFLIGRTLSVHDLQELVWAVKSGDAELVRAADRVRGRTLLHLCAAYDLVTEVRTLLELGADPWARDGQAQRPHMLANTDEVRALLGGVMEPERR